jgi:hypothetical protein
MAATTYPTEDICMSRPCRFGYDPRYHSVMVSLSLSYGPAFAEYFRVRVRSLTLNNDSRLTSSRVLDFVRPAFAMGKCAVLHGPNHRRRLAP